MSLQMTLQQIRDARPCDQGWIKLLRNLGNPPMQYITSLGEVYASNGFDDALWAARCLNSNAHSWEFWQLGIDMLRCYPLDRSVITLVSALEALVQHKLAVPGALAALLSQGRFMQSEGRPGAKAFCALLNWPCRPTVQGRLWDMVYILDKENCRAAAKFQTPATVITLFEQFLEKHNA